MQRLSTTPFGRRPVSAGLLAARQLAEAPAPPCGADKWQILRDLTTARARYRLSSPALTVLQALLSFHPAKHLAGDGPIIVFPSNGALGERAHGKSEATLRRHLAALSEAGLILRHDSPNGKRYAARDVSGEIAVAFGFDLRPLLVRSAEIAAAADAARQDAARLRRRREAVVLLVRDAGKLLEYGLEAAPSAPWAAFVQRIAGLRQALRRKLDAEALAELETDAEDALRSVEDRLRHVLETEESSGSESQIERQYQNSITDHYDLEPCRDPATEACGQESLSNDGGPADVAIRLPLALVQKACPRLEIYTGDCQGSWPDLVRSAETVRPWLGISPDAWADAVRTMGPQIAAVCVAGILERRDEIRSPGGYLRSLTARAGEGSFTPGPMIMALLKRAGPATAGS